MIKILVTGCGKGLGNCLFKELNNRNYFVIPVFKEQTKKYNNQIIGDINEERTLNSIKESFEKHNINILINNASIYTNDSFSKISNNKIRDIINTNLISQILITKIAYDYFIKRKNGLIININSLAGKNPSPNESIYCASKFGLDGFSKSLQIESIGHNIKFKDFYIGAMKTSMSKWRSDYENLLNPNYVAKYICDTFLDNKLNVTEYTIRRN